HIFLGEFGFHWFYLGKSGKGIAYLLLFLVFCWTFFVPLIVAIVTLIEGIVFLTMNEEKFNMQYNTATIYQPSANNNNAQQKSVEPEISAPAQKTETKGDILMNLKKLLDNGILTQEEFESEKKKILNG
ncbi:MAG: SHOCT domain-containing protein, partial [Prevotella sp.]|nr:SHOCT domain-containing protein [Prevotella sp.]